MSEDTPARTQGPVRFWLAEIAAARAREKEFRKEGRRVLEIYEGGKKDTIPFNILYSNTETLLPALYNNQPRPVVQRRFKDDDPLGKAASMAGQRALEYLVDTNSEEYASFDDVMTDAVLDALLPGRGATRIRYDANIVAVGESSAVQGESVCYESIKWDRWIFGFARKWKDVPWVALEHDVPKKEAEQLFGATLANELKYLPPGESDSKEEQLDRPNEVDSKESDNKTAKIYEIWDKAGGRKVRFIAECYLEKELKVDDDPLELTGFYPIPEPLRFLKKSNNLMPTAIYTLYENQAKELNRITNRINRIVEALKVRGAYDSTLGELADLLKKDDNALVPAENVAALQNGGLDKAIWLMPIDKLVAVLQQLYVARQQCKQVIYEITGISDILRGASAASETLGAQEIKQQWATLRLKRVQKEVARYARDVLRITLEIVANKFQITTFQRVTGLPYPTQEMQKAAAGQLAALRAQAAQQPQTQPSPQMDQLAQVLQAPTWEAIINGLRDETQRQYRIDIETNSTVDLEATEDQKNIAELMNAMSQFLNGVAPLVENGTMPFGAAQAMLLAITRRFRFGSEVEDQIKQMQPPQPKDDGKQAEVQMKAQLAQADQQRAALEAQSKAALEQQAAAHKQTLEVQQFRFEQLLEANRAEAARSLELQKIEAAKASEMAKLQAARATAEMQARVQQETDLKKAALQAATQIEVAQINAKKDAEAAAGEAATAGAEVAQTADIMAKILETQGRLLEAVAAPKDVVRGKDGRVAQLVPRVG